MSRGEKREAARRRREQHRDAKMLVELGRLANALLKRPAVPELSPLRRREQQRRRLRVSRGMRLPCGTGNARTRRGMKYRQWRKKRRRMAKAGRRMNLFGRKR